MVNFTKEAEIDIETGKMSGIITPLPSGGTAEEDMYETWYIYECPQCGRRVRESYQCEVLQHNK